MTDLTPAEQAAELTRLQAENAAQAVKLAAGRKVLTDRIAQWKAQQEIWQNMPTSAMSSNDWLNVESQQHRLGEVEDLLDEFDAAVGLETSEESE